MLRTALAVVLAATLTALAAQRADPPLDDVRAGWQFAVGEPMEGLHIDAARMPAATQLADLPHRVHEPNRSLWYARTLLLPPAVALYVEADDGAQVFADGVRLEHDRRWFFVPESSAPLRRIVVRVLNNAMNGGLRSVQVIAAGRVSRDSLEVTVLPEGLAPVETGAFRGRMPAPDEPCRFTAWADSQGGWATFGKLVALMTRIRPHVSVGIGDLVNDGSDPRAWRSFVDALAPLASTVPVVPVAGNHDYDGFYNDLRSRYYLDLFRRGQPSWFAWSCGPVRFAAIDVNTEFPIGVSPSSPQHRWLMDEARSAAWTQAGWRVLLVHQPPWSRSWAGYHGDDSVREIVNALATGGLDVVIAGHSHAYEHLTRTVQGREIHVLITGGAGGGLESPLVVEPEGSGTIILKHHFVDVTATRGAISVEAVDADGRAMDRWRISR